MKKRLLFILPLLMILLVATSCERPIRNAKPKFEGVENITIEKGTTFLPLEGVSASDIEDGPLDQSLITVDARSVNVNVVGTYDVIYSVTDSYGNTTTVVRKVSVVYTDTIGPVLYGVNDIEIVVGTAFATLEGVSADDNVDGVVTDNIIVSGAVNPWVTGDYELIYEVSDEAGNKTKATRVVSVGLGDFKFSSQNAIEDILKEVTVETEPYELVVPNISGGIINQEVVPFALVKVVIVASSTVAKTVSISLAGATSSDDVIILTNEVTEFVKYFRIEEELVEKELTLVFEAGEAVVTIEEAGLFFATVSDDIEPVVTIENNEEVYVPLDIDEAFVKAELLKGVTAFDNMDGNLTGKLKVDLSEVDLSVAGTYLVDITVKDSFNNVGVLTRTLVVARARNTGIILNPTFDDENTQLKLSTGGGGNVTMAIVDGALVINITAAGGWSSADSPYISGITTDQLQAGFYYLFQMDVKGTKNRRMAIRAGLELYASPWIEDFGVREPKFNITTEWTTINYIFYVHADKSEVGSKNVKFEIHLGSIDWNSNESGNIISIDNVQFYKLTNVNEAPVITQKPGVQTTYPKGSPMPDFTTFITAFDLEDGVINITNEMIDMGSFDINVPGTYNINYLVKDSDGAEATHTIKIVVTETIDTVGPVITIDPFAINYINSLLPVAQGYDLTNVIASLAQYISITDNVDGKITFNESMINYNGLNPKSPKPGSYEVMISTQDSSGNESNILVITITVSDDEAPKLVNATNMTLYLNDTYDPIKGVVAYDNFDGKILLTRNNITGLDAFLNEADKVTTTGEFQVTYEVQDASGNKVTKTVLFNVLADKPDFYEGAYVNIIGKISWLSAGGSGSTLSQAGGIATVNYKTSGVGYASGVHIKCDSNIRLVAGEVFKLVIEAEVEVPRDILIYFVDSAGNKITGFQNANDYNKHRVGLVGGGYIYEYIFVVENESVGSCTFEIDLDYEDTLANATVAQQIVFKQIKLYSTDGVLGSSADELPPVVVVENFEGFTNNEAFQAETSDVVVGLRVGSGNFDKSNGELVTINGNKLIEQNVQYLGGSTCGIRIKVSKTIIPANIEYIAIWMKTTANLDDINKIQSFIYDSSNNNTEISSSLIGDLSKLNEGTFVFIPVSVLKSNTVQLALMINIKSAAAGKLYFDDILYVKEQFSTFGNKMLENFENYDDNDAFQAATNDTVVGFRVGKSVFVKANGTLLVEDDNKFVQQEFAYIDMSVSGIRIRINKSSLPLGVKYIAIWMKASTIQDVNKFQAFIYNSANQNNEVSSNVIGNLNDLLEGAYIYIPVSVLKEDTVELALLLNLNKNATGTLTYDNICLVKEFFE